MRTITGEGVVHKGLWGPQRVWEDLKECGWISKGEAIISEGVVWASKKILRASKKYGEILRCCEDFKGRVTKKKRKKKNGEISIP